MYTVYVLKSLKDNRTYVGCSENLTERIKAHNQGLVKSTKYRIPLILWYKEEFEDKILAYKQEKFYKTAWGRRKLKKILNSLQGDSEAT